MQRGTGANYGLDGFLRPGFPYDHAIDYLHSKVIEYIETGQDLNNVLSRDWKVKFAASLVPRGLELNEEFVRSLYHQTQKHIYRKFIKELKADAKGGGDELEIMMNARRDELATKREALNYDSYWNEFLRGIERLDDKRMHHLTKYHVEIAKRLEQIITQLVEFAQKAYLYNERISSELFNQPKPPDSISDDFAVEVGLDTVYLDISSHHASNISLFLILPPGSKFCQFSDNERCLFFCCSCLCLGRYPRR